MRIGIDLDNTIIKYDDVFLQLARESGAVPKTFSGTKQEIKARLRAKPCGEIEWRRLQGRVYGEQITSAQIFPGVKQFLTLCRIRGIKVSVVSHKTKFGHCDPKKTNLREAAISFLMSRKLLSQNPDSLIDRVIFASTREEKIGKINESNFSWFIDDLLEVLLHTALSRRISRVHFCRSESSHQSPGEVVQISTWRDIERHVLGDWSEEETREGIRKVFSICPITIVGVDASKGRNSSVSRIAREGGLDLAFKRYADDPLHNRSFSDFKGSILMRQHGITNIPMPVKLDDDLNWAMFEWIRGSEVSRPSDSFIAASLMFVEKLSRISSQADSVIFPRASASILSGEEAELQLITRFERSRNVLGEEPKLRRFLDDEFCRSLTKVIDWFRLEWEKILDYDRTLPIEEQTLSPSDFGYHNCIWSTKGEYVFLDFEYFGRDDPAKLAGDFLLHPGMTLDRSHREKWLLGIRCLFGPKVLARLRILWPMLGLIWCMILLNSLRKRFELKQQFVQTEIDGILDQVVTLNEFVLANYKDPKRIWGG